jgi:hypothetical protein
MTNTATRNKLTDPQPGDRIGSTDDGRRWFEVIARDGDTINGYAGVGNLRMGLHVSESIAAVAAWVTYRTDFIR